MLYRVSAVVLCVMTSFRLVAAYRGSGITHRLPVSDFLCPEGIGKRLHPKRVKLHGVGSRSSVVSIVAALLTAKPRFHGFFSAGLRDFTPEKSCPTLGHTLSSNQSVPQLQNPRIRRPGQEAGPGYEGKNERSYIFTVTTCFKGVHRGTCPTCPTHVV